MTQLPYVVHCWACKRPLDTDFTYLVAGGSFHMKEECLMQCTAIYKVLRLPIPVIVVEENANDRIEPVCRDNI